jgi:nucleotide-binding universal stress UspA family protein
VAGKIVVGIDGGEPAAAALRWAVEEAELRDATVEAVHAWSFVPITAPPDPGLAPLAMSENTELLEVTREAAERLAADQVDRVAGEGARVAVTVTQGEPADVLVAASDGADLLVVGNRGRGNFLQLLFGSISAIVANRAHCPVVVVNAETTSS